MSSASKSGILLCGLGGQKLVASSKQPCCSAGWAGAPHDLLLATEVILKAQAFKCYGLPRTECHLSARFISIYSRE